MTLSLHYRFALLVITSDLSIPEFLQLIHLETKALKWRRKRHTLANRG